MATYGRIKEFESENEGITAYLERVNYFEANGVKDDKKVPVLLSMIGAKAYGVQHILLVPANPCEKTLKWLEEALKKQYTPKPIVNVERFKFHRRNQASAESVVDYLAKL